MKAIAVSLAVLYIRIAATCSAIGGTHGDPVQPAGSQHPAHLILTPVGADAVQLHVLLQMQQPDLVKLQDSAPAGDPPQLGSLGSLDGHLRHHCAVQTYEQA